MSDIARAAGVTKSLIHHHYGSKQALWEQMKATHFQKLAAAEATTIARPGDARQFVREAFTVYFRFLQSNPRLLRLMWWAQAEHGSSQHPAADHATQDFLAQLHQLGVERVRALQRGGGIRRDLDPRYLFAAFVALVRHWFVARQDFPAPQDSGDQTQDDGYLTAAIEILLTGILADEQR
jgi:TetR/AcrR family transcriptional regulator